MKRQRSGVQQRTEEPGELDPTFFERADAVIDLANGQLAEVTIGTVSASTLYAAARFNAWVSAAGWSSAEEMAAAKDETIAYFVEQYRAMLTENLDDYIANFDRYMRPVN